MVGEYSLSLPLILKFCGDLRYCIYRNSVICPVRTAQRANMKQQSENRTRLTMKLGIAIAASTQGQRLIGLAQADSPFDHTRV